MSARRNAPCIALAVVVLGLACVACDAGNYRLAPVVRMAQVFTPDNLSDDGECQSMWADIARLGVEMDRVRRDWNQVILTLSYQVIERGCVKRARRG
jgi:hypothetical protein